MEKTLTQHSWPVELRQTLKLAWPLIVAQLAGILLFTTDVVMMGWLGTPQLAAGTLATALLHPIFIGGIGVISATTPMIAQAIGGRQTRSVRRTLRQGFWVSIILTIGMAPILLNAEPLFLLLGQDPSTAALAQGYLNLALWIALPGLLTRTLQSVLQAKGSTTIILYITIAGIFVNGFGNYVLMFGNFGFPRLELVGAGISTSIVNLVMFLLTLAYVLVHRRYRRYHILVRFWKPDWQRFRDIFRIGLPIGLTVMSEISMFGVAVIMMGWLGTNEVAAHAVAVQCAAIAFMIPLGLSQATTVRVGLAVGAGSVDGIKKAGWASMLFTLGFMTVTCALMILFPQQLAGLFLSDTNPANKISLSLAMGYIAVAAWFQFVDGTQVVMAAALRGMSDTRATMIVAFVGYWLFGLSIAYYCGFVLQWRGVGIWMGLASGLAFVAVVLTIRFALRERLGLLQKAG